MVSLHLRLLGGFEARLASGRELRVATKKGRALLAYLSLDPALSQPREKLASVFWGDASNPQALASLRQTVADLRQALSQAAPGLLLADRNSVGLAARGHAVDVLEFERYVTEGGPAALEQAAALYRGPLLDGTTVNEPAFEEWLLAQRERLRELAVEAMRRLLAHQSWTGAIEHGIRTAGRLLAMDPLEEATHRALMGLYVRQGRRTAAQRQYQICASLLRRELAAEPEVETVQLYQSITGSSRSPRRRPTHATTTRVEAPLIGRETETTSLRGCLEIAMSGQGKIAVITGETGVGRTRLAEWVATEMTRRGGRVLAGRADEAQRTVPFAVWLDLLRFDLVHDTALVGSLDRGCRTALSHLFPELASPAEGRAAPPESRPRLFAAVARLLERASEERPLALILDDLQWAEESSLGLLAFLMRRLRRGPVLIVLTACDEHLARTSALRRMLSRLEHDQRALRLRLHPLARRAVATIARGLIPASIDRGLFDRRVEQIWRLSEGNPRVAMESIRESLRPPATGAEELAVPAYVREMVLPRLESLGADARQVLAMAAVMPEDADFPLLTDAAALPEDRVADAVEALIREGLMRTDGQRFKVSSAWVRRVVYESLLPHRRQALHAAASRAMKPPGAVTPSGDH